MGEIREAELMASLEILGVREHHWLGYRDGACASAPPEEAIAKLVRLLEEVAPDTVLTFGPTGSTGHPDHIAVGGWMTEAFRRAAGPPAKLYYSTVSPEWAARFVPCLRAYNVYAPGTPPVTAPDELAIDFKLPPDVLDLKMRAMKAHASQVEMLLRELGEEFAREANAEESFALAALG
jgi:LmbE family N-acetylglucosaminyl deacetylase